MATTLYIGGTATAASARAGDSADTLSANPNMGRTRICGCCTCAVRDWLCGFHSEGSRGCRYPSLRFAGSCPDAGGFLTIGNAKDVEPERRLAFLHDLEDRVRSIPGIESVGGATALPLHWVGAPDGVAWSADQIPADPSHKVDLETVLPGYFETLRSRVLEGRTFTDADNASGQSLAVIDQSLAEKIFPNQSALDRRICVYIPDPAWLRVIGVVDHQRLHSLADP